jgi:hypothetical protein
MNLRKLLIYSIILMVIFNIISLLSSEAVPYTTGATWGGTVYHGFPLRWYVWSGGDVLYLTNVLTGTINWLNLIVDLIFWFITGLVVSFVILKLKKK